MGIKRNIPQITALHDRVETKFGKPLVTHADFLALVAEIEVSQRQHISESTLERVWGYSTRGYDTVSLRTLDVLSIYGAGCYWKQFCGELQRDSESESELFSVESILATGLEVGDRLQIGWLPDRMCIVRYLGDGCFVADECHNSKMQVGDTFVCPQFILGKRATLSNFCRKNNPETSYTCTIGNHNGLTMLQLLK